MSTKYGASAVARMRVSGSSCARDAISAWRATERRTFGFAASATWTQGMSPQIGIPTAVQRMRSERRGDDRPDSQTRSGIAPLGQPG
jgi:hypothetical protein